MSSKCSLTLHDHLYGVPEKWQAIYVLVKIPSLQGVRIYTTYQRNFGCVSLSFEIQRIKVLRSFIGYVASLPSSSPAFQNWNNWEEPGYEAIIHNVTFVFATRKLKRKTLHVRSWRHYKCSTSRYDDHFHVSVSVSVPVPVPVFLEFQLPLNLAVWNSIAIHTCTWYKFGQILIWWFHLQLSNQQV